MNEETTVRRVVLLVDDDAESRVLTRTRLEAAGVEVVDTATPQSALDEADARHPDVIVLDHDLHADVTGLELAPLFARRHPGTKVLMYSVLLTEADDQHPGVDAVLNKLDGGGDRLVATVLDLASAASAT
jgi:CheY-like chemotaxis protein